MATNRKAAAIKAKARKDTPAANGDKIANGTEIANSESRLFCAGASARSDHSACISKPATETKIQKLAPPASHPPMATANTARPIPIRLRNPLLGRGAGDRHRVVKGKCVSFRYQHVG